MLPEAPETLGSHNHTFQLREFPMCMCVLGLSHKSTTLLRQTSRLDEQRSRATWHKAQGESSKKAEAFVRLDSWRSNRLW
jgi:hypothetical protein